MRETGPRNRASEGPRREHEHAERASGRAAGDGRTPGGAGGQTAGEVQQGP
jgi:hypothetical protein